MKQLNASCRKKPVSTRGRDRELGKADQSDTRGFREHRDSYEQVKDTHSELRGSHACISTFYGEATVSPPNLFMNVTCTWRSHCTSLSFFLANPQTSRQLFAAHMTPKSSIVLSFGQYFHPLMRPSTGQDEVRSAVRRSSQRI